MIKFIMLIIAINISAFANKVENFDEWNYTNTEVCSSYGCRIDYFISYIEIDVREIGNAFELSLLVVAKNRPRGYIVDTLYPRISNDKQKIVYFFSSNVARIFKKRGAIMVDVVIATTKLRAKLVPDYWNETTKRKERTECRRWLRRNWEENGGKIQIKKSTHPCSYIPKVR